uniref:Uncharacterized protein n=1 Tax=Vitis vinifera TaxID=29760 RepID=F6GWC5_VITVI
MDIPYSNVKEVKGDGKLNGKLVIGMIVGRLTRRRRKGGERGREWAVRAMPCSSKNTSSSSRDDNGALRAFKLSESTFLASLIPKKGIAADRFVEAHSKYDAREVVVAIFECCFYPDSGVLQVTSGGKPKIFDVLDSLGSGDIDTSTVVKADSNGCLGGASGASLVVNSSWKNPSGEWHVGYKVVYELCTDTLTSGLKSYDDKGPIIDAVVWNGEPWRATLDRQSLEDDPGCWKFADFVTVTNYRSSHEPTVDGDLWVCISPPRKFDFASALCVTI